MEMEVWREETEIDNFSDFFNTKASVFSLLIIPYREKQKSIQYPISYAK